MLDQNDFLRGHAATFLGWAAAERQLVDYWKRAHRHDRARLALVEAHKSVQHARHLRKQTRRLP